MVIVYDSLGLKFDRVILGCDCSIGAWRTAVVSLASSVFDVVVVVW